MAKLPCDYGPTPATPLPWEAKRFQVHTAHNPTPEIPSRGNVLDGRRSSRDVYANADAIAHRVNNWDALWGAANLQRDELVQLRSRLIALAEKWEAVDHPTVQGWLKGAAAELLGELDE